MTEYGVRRTRSVNWPPSSYPTYPGGAPISFETECFSMNSDMSKRTSDFSEPNKNSASLRATSVLPTPVGPRKKKQPTGRSGDFSPARLRRIARASAVMALSWLITRLCSSGSMRSSFCCSSSLIEVTPTPVQLETLPQPAQVFFFLVLFFGIEARLLDFLIGDRCFHPVRNEFHALLHFADFFGNCRLPQFHARSGLVNQINSFVRKKTIGNVAVRKINGIAQSLVGVTDRVELLIPFPHALYHQHRFFFVRSGHLYRLEAPL